LANQGLPAPIRDIDIPQTLYPWGNYTDEQREQGYVLPVYTPEVTSRMPGVSFSDRPQTTRTTVTASGPDVDTSSYRNDAGETVVVDGYYDSQGRWTPPTGVASDTTQDDWDCGPHGEPYLDTDGVWYCSIKQEDDYGTHLGYRLTRNRATRKAARGGPINAGIGNLMSRQRQYAYPDGTRMVEEISQGRFPLRRRNV
tara:strand:- start:205 stop:798 length:594 start_codon:yes stop_codon:yes gene_type:complete